MEQSIARQLQSYVLWQKDRGLRAASWQINSQVLPRQVLPPPSIIPEPVAPASDSPPSQHLTKGAGSPHPRLLCCTTFYDGDERLIAGPARELLLKMLQAIDLDLRRDVYLLGLKVGERGTPLEEKEFYQAEIAYVVKQLRPELILTLGSVTTYLAHGAGQSFLDLKNQWLPTPYLDQALALMPLWHPNDILEIPQLKRETWGALQLVMARLKSATPHGRT